MPYKHGGIPVPIVRRVLMRPIRTPMLVVHTDSDSGAHVLFYHHGVAIHPSVLKTGHAFVARVSILGEDGEATSLGDLGCFANRQSAFAFAVRCGTAFVDNEPMPKPPCKARHA
jgi:hypothetical protein